MQYSDTTNKDGIIQTIEFWCGLSDAEISGDATKLKRFTGRVNRAFDKVLPLVLSYTDHLRFDDPNHSDAPIGTFDLESGKGNYTVDTDDNSLAILNIVNVSILTGSSATEYQPLERVTLDDPRAPRMLSPNPSDSGVPTAFLEHDNTIFFDKKPNYNATAGGKIIFEREPSYFTSSDTTKQPGIPKPFHELLALYPSHDYLIVYKPDNQMLITRVENEITKQEKNLSDMVSKRNPTRGRITTSYARGNGNQSGRIARTYGDSNE